MGSGLSFVLVSPAGRGKVRRKGLTPFREARKIFAPLIRHEWQVTQDYSRIPSASSVNSTSEPTTTPPRSSGEFQLTPKSWRLSRPVATNPARVFGPLSTPSSHHRVSQVPRTFGSRVTGLVTPRMVPRPWTF